MLCVFGDRKDISFLHLQVSDENGAKISLRGWTNLPLIYAEHIPSLPRIVWHFITLHSCAGHHNKTELHK